MNGYLLILVLSVTVEALVEYVKSITRAFTKSEFKTAITQITAILLSTMLCFATKADIYSLIGMGFNSPWLGTLLTGVFLSRGANFISDLIRRLHGLNTTQTPQKL